MRDLLSIVNLEHIVAYEEAAALHHLEENTATGATSGPAGVGSAGSKYVALGGGWGLLRVF